MEQLRLRRGPVWGVGLMLAGLIGVGVGRWSARAAEGPWQIAMEVPGAANVPQSFQVVGEELYVLLAGPTEARLAVYEKATGKLRGSYQWPGPPIQWPTQFGPLLEQLQGLGGMEGLPGGGNLADLFAGKQEE